MRPISLLPVSVVLLVVHHLRLVSPFALEYPTSRDTYEDILRQIDFPCGGFELSENRTAIALDSFPLLFALSGGDYRSVSVILAVGYDVRYGFDTVLSNRQVIAGGDICWSNITVPDALAIKTGDFGTIQVIASGGWEDRPMYTCADVKFVDPSNLSITKQNCGTVVSGSNILSLTEKLANGSIPLPSSASHSQSSGLSTGGKIGIGFGIPIVVIVAVILLFLWLRWRKPQKQQDRSPKAATRTDTAFGEKSELHGGPFDPAIAGPVKAKPELSTTLAGANAPWSHAQEGYMPEELGHNPVAYELGLSSLDASQKRTLTRKPVPGEMQKDQSSSSATAVGTDDEQNARQAELATEADLLVQELGLISMRKKALTASASTQKLKPEDVEGAKGEDWRDLLRREERLRQRIEEIEKERTGVS